MQSRFALAGNAKSMTVGIRRSLAGTSGLQTHGNALRRPSPPTASTKSWLETLGTIVLAVIMLMPVMGVFYPPDIWLSYPGDDVTARQTMSTTLPLTQAVARLGSGAALFWLLKDWRRYLVHVKYSFLILLQLLAFCSSIFWSGNIAATSKECFSLLITYLLLLRIVDRYSLSEFIGFATRLFGIAALASFAVIIFLPGMSHNLGATDYLSAFRGAFVQKNVLGIASSLAVLTASYSWYISANTRLLAGLVVGANAVLLIGSDSVTSILTTAVGLTIYGIAYLSRNFFGRLLVLLLALVAGLLAIAVVTNVDSLAELVGRTSGLTGRTQLWQILEGLIAQRPLHGYGLGFWEFQNQEINNVWLELKWAAPEAHNDVIDVLLQTGYVGFAFYLLNNCTAVFLGLRRFGHLEDGSIFCLVIIVVFFYRSYTETATVIAAGKNVLLLYIAEAYLYKLSFSQPARRYRLRNIQPSAMLMHGPTSRRADAQ
jgi:O-antigen ligase